MNERDFKTTDSIFVETYAGNKENKEAGRPIVPHPGEPRVVEYRFLCKKVDPIKE